MIMPILLEWDIGHFAAFLTEKKILQSFIRLLLYFFLVVLLFPIKNIITYLHLM